MKLPKIASDDLMLFGSLALAAIGAGIITLTSTDDFGAALGVTLLVFGLPSCLIAFMAASQETK